MKQNSYDASAFAIVFLQTNPVGVAVRNCYGIPMG